MMGPRWSSTARRSLSQTPASPCLLTICSRPVSACRPSGWDCWRRSPRRRSSLMPTPTTRTMTASPASPIMSGIMSIRRCASVALAGRPIPPPSWSRPVRPSSTTWASPTASTPWRRTGIGRATAIRPPTRCRTTCWMRWSSTAGRSPSLRRGDSIALW